MVPNNKLHLARRLNVDLLPGWIADSNGVPIMEEAPVPAEKFLKLPLGSTREMGSHKGYGLSLMVEVFAGFLNGPVPFAEVPRGVAHTLVAYNIEAFTDLDDFKDRMDARLKDLRETKPAPGYDRVLYPGLYESETQRERLARGIPLHPDVVEWFDETCAALGIPTLERAR